MTNRLLALLAFGVLGGIRATAVGDVPQTSGADEAPVVAITGYGVSGLVLWLAADSGVTMDKSNNLISLADKTGNFILTPNDPGQAPTYVPNGLNGRPVLRFNGNQSLYSSDNFGTALNRDMTIIFVAMTTSPANQEEFSLYLGQNATQGANRALPYFNGKLFFDGQYVGCYGEPVVTKTVVMEGASINPALTQATFYRNGKQIIVGYVSDENRDQNRNAAFGNLSEGVTMGAATDPCCAWQGDIAEELVYNHQLTPAEMQQVWSYLSSKYGLHQAVTSQPSVQVTPPAVSSTL